MGEAKKLEDRWEEYLESLPLAALSAGKEDDVPLSEEQTAFRELEASLPVDLPKGGSLPEVHAPAPEELRWCLCETPEGEFPRISVYASLKQLLSSIASREGQETAVWGVYGLPLKLSCPVSVGGRGDRTVRYLMLPGDYAAEVSGQSDELRLIAKSDLPANLRYQEDGWMGLMPPGEADYFLPGYSSSEDEFESAEEPDEEFTDDTGDDEFGEPPAFFP